VSALSWAGAASLMTSPRAFAAEGPLETVSVRITKNQGICYAPAVFRRGVAARRRLYRYRICRHDSGRNSDGDRAGQSRFRYGLCAAICARHRCRCPDHGYRRGHGRMRGIVRPRRHSQYHRSERKEGRPCREVAAAALEIRALGCESGQVLRTIFILRAVLVIANGSPVAPAAALPAETVSPSNPHRRQPPTRRPAGSFLGAFGRRPSARATSNDGPASETLHQSGSSTG